MKQLVLATLTLLTASWIMAQDGSNGFLLAGSVIYEQTVKLDIQLEGDAAQFAHALPKERKSEKILHFTEEAALYENHQSDNPEEVMNMDGGGTMMIKMVEPDNKVYTDLAKKKQIEQREFMSRLFLIESECDQSGWKLTGEQKMILDYACQEAVTEADGKPVHAWFTPQISVPAGPESYSSLPGLVLAVDINEGEKILEATTVDLQPVEAQLMKKPKKGKKVTQEEFQAIVEEKMKEMGAEHEGGGNHVFTVRIRQ